MTVLQGLQEALGHFQAGRMAQAEQAYRRVIALDPNNFPARVMLGSILALAGRMDDALEQSEAAVRLQPNSPDALSNHAFVLNQAGRFDAALAAADKALRRKPDQPQAAFNRASTLWNLHRFAEAVAQYDALLAMQPNFPDVHNNRANALRNMGRLDEALIGHTKAVAQKPRDADAAYNRAVTLKEMKRNREALTGFERALALRPEFPIALYGKANTLWELGRFEESLASADRALALAPEFAPALFARAIALWELKRLTESLAAQRKLMAMAPDFAYALGSAANVAMHLCDWKTAAALIDPVEQAVRGGTAAIPPFVLTGLSGDPALLRQCAEQSIALRVPVMPPPLCQGPAPAREKIRIAYVSSDFYEHPVATQIVELIERHDRDRFVVMGVSTGRDDGGPTRKRLVKCFDPFLEAQSLHDRAVAEWLHAQGADIVIDLGGHTHGTRLEIFSHRPAPVAATWLGYPGTTGAGFIDYVIADPVTAPFAHQPFFREKIVQLPHSVMPNDTARRIGTAPSRAAMGLPQEGFVFCAFNKDWKIAEPVFAVWMRLLAAVPGSVLWLKREGGESGDNLRAAARDAGIDPARLVLAERLDNQTHLARQKLADLFLDTLPYNAHATACDALWVGLPLVTCRGNAFAGRVAAGLLAAIGLPELVTDDLVQYEELALALARDPVRLKTLRDKLAANRLSAPLFDMALFARNLESAYARMHGLACAGEAPRGFAVSALNDLSS